MDSGAYAYTFKSEGMPVVRPSQERHANALFETEGLCGSLHDDPAKWAAMIFGYFDESGESGDGYVVVAGFVGRKKSWRSFVEEWSKVTGGRQIHLATMRLGLKKAPKRFEKLLKDLAAIPPRVGLRPFVGSVKTSDYADSIKGTIAELTLKGYPIALLAMLDAILNSDFPKRDRIEFIFEQQKEFEIERARAFDSYMRAPEHRTHHNKSRIARHSSQERSVLLEASDYLAYAVLQQLLDPSSQKATLTAPILAGYGGITHREFAKEQIDDVIRSSLEEGGRTTFAPMDRDRKAFIKGALKEDLLRRTK